MPVQQRDQMDGQPALCYQSPPESLVVSNTARAQEIQRRKKRDYREDARSVVRRGDELPVR